MSPLAFFIIKVFRIIIVFLIFRCILVIQVKVFIDFLNIMIVSTIGWGPPNGVIILFMFRD